MNFDSSGAVVKYGDRETLTYGSVKGLQFQLYRKDKAIDKVAGAIHIWHDVWNRSIRSDGLCFDPDRPVWRMEYRFHHSVVNQFAESTGHSLSSFVEVADYLKNLFQYGLSVHRLDCGRYHIDPFWQFLYQDIDFQGNETIVLKRSYEGMGSNEERRLTMAVAYVLRTSVIDHGMNWYQVIKVLSKAGLLKQFKMMMCRRDIPWKKYIRERVTLVRQENTCVHLAA